MKTAQHDRARHDHMRRAQAALQSDVEYRREPMNSIEAKSIAADEIGPDWRNDDRSLTGIALRRMSQF